ncbi:DUF6920 family protein [Salinibaculum salinum]|uniref:DUF6920 family protein n=1 Tax=Salinibaculum salinum TaxID=3131996 RepID=UPI0030EF7D39
MTRLTARRAAALGIAVLAALAVRQRRRAEREVRRRIGELVADTDPQTGVVTSEDIESAPPPIRRYFDHALAGEQPVVRRARFHQRGEFRLGNSWHPLTATEWVTTRPPGLLWDATIDVAPFLPVRVVDRYQHGKGVLDARIRSTVPVAQAGPTPEMNEAELLRYLAEAVWYPTALLPSQGVEWEPVDETSARATIEDGGVTASAVFHVGPDDTVARVTAERYRQEDGQYAPWVGQFRNYERREGMLVPTEGEVAWETPDGEAPYWRATIDELSYTMARVE